MLRRLNIAGAIVSAVLCIVVFGVLGGGPSIPSHVPLPAPLAGWRLLRSSAAISFDDKLKQVALLERWQDGKRLRFEKTIRLADALNEAHARLVLDHTPETDATYDAAKAA